MGRRLSGLLFGTEIQRWEGSVGVLKRFLFLITGVGWFIAKEIATRDVPVIVSSLLMGVGRAYTYDTGGVITAEAAQHSWASVKS